METFHKILREAAPLVLALIVAGLFLQWMDEKKMARETAAAAAAAAAADATVTDDGSDNQR